jgi:hypothetical protein
MAWIHPCWTEPHGHKEKKQRRLLAKAWAKNPPHTGCDQKHAENGSIFADRKSVLGDEINASRRININESKFRVRSLRRTQFFSDGFRQTCRVWAAASHGMSKANGE